MESVDLLEGIATTRAIRRYRRESIPRDDLAKIMFAASRAPSGSNRQNFRFLTLIDGERATEAKAMLGDSFRARWQSKRASDGYEQGSGDQVSSPKARLAQSMRYFVENFEHTPVVVLPCTRRRYNTLTDGASVYPACQNLLLAARALGYGGVITGWHKPVEPELRILLSIPDDFEIVATIPLGKPQGSHGPVRRRPLAELVYEDSWEGVAPWAKDPPGTRFTQAGPPPNSGAGSPM
ncbi:MAG: nitroreductase family protein [Actinomycetia bacterium]|nr:nitroreductase family protein [Actinomycetes bacterium]